MSSFKSSFFISFEGIDGCGKSTQVKLLNKKMKSMSIDSIVVREPGGNTISEDIRGILLNNDFFNMSSRTEALLMAASRSQLTRDIIIPSLSKGSLIIADRYSDSTLAYQGGGRGIDVEWLISLNKFATYNTKPDLTIYLDVEVEEGLRRRKIKNLDRRLGGASPACPTPPQPGDRLRFVFVFVSCVPCVRARRSCACV